MTRPALFHEATAERKVQAVPLSHVSIELGHLYCEDFDAGPERLRRAFARVAPWARAAREIAATQVSGRTPRISTCFLIDDYFGPIRPPGEVLPALLAAAESNGLTIDYLVRESACAEADGVPLARLVEERIVADPPPQTNGVRPPVAETGWLCNGERSTVAPSLEAMELVGRWRPPRENSARRHSVFVDVELWDEHQDSRTWSCAFLAAVWQLLRLGLLRYRGAPVAVPRPAPEEWPERWEELPPVMRLGPSAAPFCAYRTLSVLPGRFFPTEHAVRTVLSQVAVDAVVAGQVRERSQAEGITLPAEPVDRLEYVFFQG